MAHSVDVHETHSRRVLTVFVMLAAVVITLVMMNVVGIVFVSLGVPLWLVLIIVPGSLIGSIFNIPLTTIVSDTAECTHQYVTLWGITYRVYPPDCPGRTHVSVNVGGAIIPVLVSLYLMASNLYLLAPTMVAVVIVALLVHQVARIEPEVGIVTPALLPALIAGMSAVWIGNLVGALGGHYVIAYVAGTLGTLIGADLLNLDKLHQLKAGKASIGGAGTWDGVFLTGIIAVFLV